MSFSSEDTRGIVSRAIRRIVPDADVEHLTEDADLRQAFELDSLDFLGLVELLSKDTGIRIDESDYPELATLATFTRFLNRVSS
jgi:acyl carrier protein